MNPSPHAPALAEDALLNLEMNVARRADAIARGAPSDRGADLAHWGQAEQEVLGMQLPAACVLQ